jgi:serine/threonine protein kinase
MAIGPGSLVGRRFRVTERLARGGMADVWAAVEEGTGTAVVVKTPRATALARPDLLKLFDREATLLSRINSEHVARFYGYFKDGEQPCIVCERLVGQTLAERLRASHILTLADLGPIVEHVLLALADTHDAGILHRDLSPHNVFLCGTPEVAKLIDFGVGKRIEDSMSMTPPDATIGSFAYMAPEQWLDPSSVDARADIYALGTVIFQALTGRLPFPEKNPSRLLTIKRDFDAPTLGEVIRAPYPPSVAAFVAKALARNRDARFASATAMLDAWGQVFSGSAWSEPAAINVMAGQDEGGDTTATMTHMRRKS